MVERKGAAKETFTGTEVGALIESLRNDIRIIADDDDPKEG